MPNQATYQILLRFPSGETCTVPICQDNKPPSTPPPSISCHLPLWSDRPNPIAGSRRLAWREESRESNRDKWPSVRGALLRNDIFTGCFNSSFANASACATPFISLRDEGWPLKSSAHRGREGNSIWMQNKRWRTEWSSSWLIKLPGFSTSWVTSCLRWEVGELDMDHN